MTNGSVPPRPGSPQPAKKGLPIWAWIGIGCLGILVLGGVALSIAGMYVASKVGEFAQQMEDDPIAGTAQLLAAADPTIELVEADKDARVLTFRHTETGEEFTFSYEDMEEGRISFSSNGEDAGVEFNTDSDSEGSMTITTDEGTTTFGAGAGTGEAPSWLPQYPGVTAEGTYSSETNDMSSGAFHFTTSDAADQVMSFYASQLESAGFEIGTRVATGDGAMMVASSSDQTRTVTVACNQESGGLDVVVNFNEQR